MKKRIRKYCFARLRQLTKTNLNVTIKIRTGLFNFLCLLLYILFFNSSITLSQRQTTEKEQNKKIIEKNAEIALQEGKFEKALLLYNRLLEEDEKNPLLNFLVGYCYLNTDFGLEQSITFLTKSIEYSASNPENEAPYEAYYYLAKAYHANYQFAKAIKTLNEVLSKIPKNEIEFISKVNILLEYAENGKQLAQSPAKVKIENILDLNSKYSDKNPLINNKSNIMIFTSRRENPLTRKKNEDGQFDENVFISEKIDENWTLPDGLSNSVNTVEHEYACWLSDEGKQLILVRLDKTGSSLFLCKKNENNEWGFPEKLDYPINNGSATTFGSLSPDGKFLYFASDRKGGYGGTDIYVSEFLGNNKWGEVKNLGPKINTPYNEESPFLHQNGVLFFSSEGHMSMGGYDIYSSIRDASGNWQIPVNMGIPINSTNNDFFYRPNSDGQSAYLSSDRNGTKGNSDIFKLDYSDSLMRATAIVAGSISCPNGIDASSEIKIKIKNQKDRKEISINPTRYGKYLFNLLSDNNYSIEFTYQDKAFYFAKLEIKKSYSPSCADQTLILKNIDLKPENVSINNANNQDNYTSISMETDNIKNSYLLAFNEKNSNNSIIGNNVQNIDSIYSIKLATSKSKIPLNGFTGLTDVKEIRDNNGNYLYYLGEYNYEWEALLKLKMIQEDYPNATVFINRKDKMTLEN